MEREREIIESAAERRERKLMNERTHTHTTRTHTHTPADVYLRQLVHSLTAIVSVHVHILCSEMTPLKPIHRSQVTWYGTQTQLISLMNYS